MDSTYSLAPLRLLVGNSAVSNQRAVSNESSGTPVRMPGHVKNEGKSKHRSTGQILQHSGRRGPTRHALRN